MKNLYRTIALIIFLAILVTSATSVFAAKRKYPFTCYIPWIGSHNCSNQTYTMSPGKFVKVKFETSSGGSCAWFSVHNVSNDAELGAQWICPGSKATVWTNNTDQTVQVYFKADSDLIFDDTLTGKFIFGEY